jgi:DNA-directed RNA polymerase specialized sigma24 family protein
LTDWKEKAMSHWGLINRLAGRRFASAGIAEEAALFVINGLEDNNWQRLRNFSGNASLTTYLSTLAFRLLEDFSRKKFGRLRPPLWIRNLGGVWELLFRFLCQERLPVGEAIEHVQARMPTEERASIEDSAWTIRAEVTDCGNHQNMEVPLKEEYDCSDPEAESQQQHLEEAERNLFFTALFKGLFDTDREDAMTGSLTRVLTTGVRLEAEERLLLKMCFRDSIGVTEAGRMLGMNRHQVHSRLRRLFIRLRSDFEKAGISEELRILLEE